MRKLSKRECVSEADVIIIGGGPAGTSAALHLLRIDPKLAERSLLIEKETHPREKICGGALTLNAERIIDDLGISLQIPFAPVHHVQLTYGNATINLPESGCAKRVIRRRDFDNLLFQTAKERGFRTTENMRVRRIVRHPDHLIVVTDQGCFRTRAIIGADGVGAVVRKTTGFTSGKLGRLWVAEVPVDPGVSRCFTEQVLTIDLSYTREGLKGYYWEFPCFIGSNPFLSTGIVDSNPISTNRVGGHDYLHGILERRGIDTSRAVRKAFPIRHFNPRERFSRPRMLLAGDALGSDPLFSEGISQALEFGRLAAETVSDGFACSDLSFSRYTKDILRSRVGKELAAYTRVSRFFYGPRAESFLSMLYREPELRQLIGCSYAGTQNMHRNTLSLIKHFARHVFHAKENMAAFQKVVNGSGTHPPLASTTPS